MISALLLPVMLATAPAAVPAVTATNDDPPIRLWINERSFFPGDRATVQVRTEYDGYLIVLHVDPDGSLRVVFPIDPDKDNFIRGGKKYEVRGRGGRETFETDGKGRGIVYAAVSRDPFRFDGFVMGDHWDYKALAPSRLAEDPEPELNELVQRMAQSSFDYDVITYEVVDRSAYASEYYPSYHGSVYNDPWCFSCGSYYGSPYGFSIGLFFGHPYRPFYYNPYYYAYDPYYYPFFYSPYYYAPAYYPRYSYPRHGYYYGHYNGFYYWDRNRSYRSYTPYRFRGADGILTGYRDRRYDLRRSVNTVYNSPFTRSSQPGVSRLGRRVADGPTSELPSRAAPRRTVGHEQRLGNERVEARRAREREPGIGNSPDAIRGERRPTEARPEARRATEARRDDQRGEPRLERRREEPRAIEREPTRRPERETRPAPAPAPRREVERSSPPPQDRGGSRGEGRGAGGGSRSADGGGRRRS